MALTQFIERLKASSNSLEDQLAVDPSQVVFSSSSSSSQTTENSLSNKLLQPEAARTYLKSLYPALRRHYDWFRRTQRGQIKQWNRRASSRTEAYRWRGRTEDHVLTSGLDDYPRAKPPHVGELHLDLISWMGFFARTMRDIASFVGESEDEALFSSQEKAILQNIEGSCCLVYEDLV